jgi:protein TonB
MIIYSAKKLQWFSILISIALHLLLLVSLSYVLVFHPIPIKEDSPDLYIPAYVSEDQQTPSVLQQENKKNDRPVADDGIEKPIATEAAAKSAKAQNANQLTQIDLSKDEPVHMIGNKSIDNPLLTLLGKALTKQLFYPKIALDFRVVGVVLIGFMLHPDGHITDVKLMRSSQAGVLDEAVVKAVHAISPVPHVTQYLKQPKFLVISIIFGNEKPRKT